MARILVIDDQELVRQAIRVVLEAKGHEVLEADDGKVGIGLQKEQPCELVITDIFMPVKEGLETITELKQDYIGLKIIAISGGGRTKSEDYLKVAGSLGADKVLTKPFSNAQLLLCVDECLQQDKP
jgi:CheY-like chemotaxis protein